MFFSCTHISQTWSRHAARSHILFIFIVYFGSFVESCTSVVSWVRRVHDDDDGDYDDNGDYDDGNGNGDMAATATSTMIRIEREAPFWILTMLCVLRRRHAHTHNSSPNQINQTLTPTHICTHYTDTDAHRTQYSLHVDISTTIFVVFILLLHFVVVCSFVRSFRRN